MAPCGPYVQAALLAASSCLVELVCGWFCSGMTPCGPCAQVALIHLLLLKGGSNVTLSWENKTNFLTRTSAAHEQSDGRRSGRAWWPRAAGGRRPGSGYGHVGCQRVSHFCGAVARARAAQAAARAHAAGRDGALGGRHCACPCSLHRQRRAPILGSPCSPDFSGAFSRTGGARACAPRQWRMLEF